MVDYRKIMSLKRRAMEELSKCLLSSESARREDFRRFTKENPLIEKYAAFRAVMEKRQAPWNAWPQSLRDGTITAGDFDKAIEWLNKLIATNPDVRHHKFVQDGNSIQDRVGLICSRIVRK